MTGAVCTCPNVPEGGCYGCAPSVFGLDPGPAGARPRAAVRGLILGGAVGALLGGPGGMVLGGLLSAVANGLFGDALDRKLRGA